MIYDLSVKINLASRKPSMEVALSTLATHSNNASVTYLSFKFFFLLLFIVFVLFFSVQFW